jgi:enoyl-CoA hydratase
MPQKTTEEILLQIDAPIASIILNRPAKLNALTAEMLQGLEDAVDQLENAKEVRVVLLQAAGEKAFCVGADINSWSALESQEMWRWWTRNGNRIFMRLAELRQPVIAVLNGYTFGGGLELALAADLRIAANTVECAMPETSIATVPGWGATFRLPALIGVARAKELIFTGKRINATTAETWGLFNESVAADDLQQRALEMARQIAANAPLSVQAAKQLLNATVPPNAGIALEALAGGLSATTQDAQEGLAAFKERRPSDFKGR